MKPLLRWSSTTHIKLVLSWTDNVFFFNDSSQGFAAIHDSDGNWVSLRWMLCMESTTNLCQSRMIFVKIYEVLFTFFLSKVRVQIPYTCHENMWFVNQWDCLPSWIATNVISGVVQLRKHCSYQLSLSKIMVTLLENALIWQMNPTPGIVHPSICICAQIWSAPEMNTFYEIPPRPKC